MPDPRLVILDLDGTLYRGEEVVPHALEAVQRLTDRGVLVRYLTNNSTQTLETYAAKLAAMGFPATLEMVESSASGTAFYLSQQGVSLVGVVGEPGLVASLRAEGLDARGPDEEWPDAVEGVVVGLHRQFTYAHVSKAMQAVRAGAKFVATNRDSTFPQEGGKFIPGAGAVVASVATAAGQEPFVVGKPQAYLVELILGKTGIPAAETLVVGDRMDTDIEAGLAAGCQVLLVLTGVTTSRVPGIPTSADLSTLA